MSEPYSTGTVSTKSHQGANRIGRPPDQNRGPAFAPPMSRHLVRFLTFVAGAANAGGFLAVQQYTSHMSRIVSSMADNLALGDVGLVLSGLGWPVVICRRSGLFGGAC